MTLQEELRYYELALADWEKTKENPDLEDELNTASGLCYYFNNTHGIDIYSPYRINMPVLQGIMPKGLIDRYGFPQPRIALLKKAIEIVKQKIEDETL